MVQGTQFMKFGILPLYLSFFSICLRGGLRDDSRCHFGDRIVSHRRCFIHLPADRFALELEAGQLGRMQILD